MIAITSLLITLFTLKDNNYANKKRENNAKNFDT